MSNSFFKALKIRKKCQIYDLINHGVLWAISKSTKIRDQGMEMQFFCVAFENMYPWCVFQNNGGFFVFFQF